MDACYFNSCEEQLGYVPLPLEVSSTQQYQLQLQLESLTFHMIKVKCVPQLTCLFLPPKQGFLNDLLNMPRFAGT